MVTIAYKDSFGLTTDPAGLFPFIVKSLITMFSFSPTVIQIVAKPCEFCDHYQNTFADDGPGVAAPQRGSDYHQNIQ